MGKGRPVSQCTGLKGGHVLIVEDEYLIGFSLAEELEELGFSTSGPFRDCTAALAWSESNTPDMAVLDVYLGDGTCLIIAREMRKRGVPFVLFSGHRGPHPRPKGEFSDILQVDKPASTGDVLAALQRACDLVRPSGQRPPDELACASP